VKLQVGCRFDYKADVGAPAVAVVEPHSSVRDDVMDDHWDGVASMLPG